MKLLRIGMQIKKERNKNHLTQATLAEKINKSPNFISDVECGKKSAGLETMVEIANELGVSLDTLLKSELKLKDSIIDKELCLKIQLLESNEKTMIMNVVESLLSERNK